ncbi:Anti-sigma F factor [Lachnospiraceae bacterium TWA4]|nr:Anti-sigma F factor [Lachnospiraceae bacterium TWA4]
MKFYLEVSSDSSNEQFVRTVVAGFLTPLNPTIEELEDIKTAVSEAITNCIIHAYENSEGKICITCTLDVKTITIKIKDFGKGIEDLIKAKTPFYTSKPEMERSGMGFTFMESFMDQLLVESTPNIGTCVTLIKTLS